MVCPITQGDHKQHENIMVCPITQGDHNNMSSNDLSTLRGVQLRKLCRPTSEDKRHLPFLRPRQNGECETLRGTPVFQKVGISTFIWFYAQRTAAMNFDRRDVLVYSFLTYFTFYIKTIRRVAIIRQDCHKNRPSRIVQSTKCNCAVIRGMFSIDKNFREATAPKQ